MRNQISLQLDRLEKQCNEKSITKSFGDDYSGGLCYNSQQVADDSCA